MEFGRKFGLRRTPVLTLSILALTGAVNVAQLAHHDILSSLERTPAGLHGEWWRTFTSLFVQDGGVLGTVSNLVFLLAIGSIAEQTLTRSRWLLHYFGIGVLTELLAYVWQPTGGGNSIAVCGLSGAVAVAALNDDRRLPAVTAQILPVWMGALVATVSSALYIPAIALGIAVSNLLTRRAKSGNVHAIHMMLAGMVAAVGLALCCLTNIHGAALLTGALLGLITTGVRRQRMEPADQSTIPPFNAHAPAWPWAPHPPIPAPSPQPGYMQYQPAFSHESPQHAPHIARRSTTPPPPGIRHSH